MQVGVMADIINDDTNQKIDTLSTRQDIYSQIDKDILGHKQSKFKIKQKTRSNYKFVVVLDLIAVFFAMMGSTLVYTIFKEQQIQLVTGQDAIEVLESTLLEQLNLQYSIDMLAKEQEIALLKMQLTTFTDDFEGMQQQIEIEVQLKYAEEKMRLEKQLAEDLQGKVAEEREAILREFANRIASLDQGSLEEREERLRDLNVEYQESLRAQESQLIDLQVEMKQIANKQVVNTRKAEMVALTNTNYINLSSVKYKELVEFDTKIADLFKDVRTGLERTNYQNIGTPLKEIETLYDGQTSTKRKEMDLYLLNLVHDYTNVAEQNKVLERKVAQSSANGTDLEMKKLVEELNTFSDMVVSKRRVGVLEKQVGTINDRLPELLDFVDNYDAYRFSDDIIKVEELREKAREHIEAKRYDKGISEYQDILTFYPGVQQKEVVRELYAAVTLKLQGGENTFVEIEENIAQQELIRDVAEILKGPDLEKPNYKIVYMKNPDGYIVDIIGNEVLIYLIPGKVVAKNQDLYTYRVVSDESFRMDSVATLTSAAKGAGTIKAEKKWHDLKIGDLIYLKPPNP